MELHWECFNGGDGWVRARPHLYLKHFILKSIRRVYSPNEIAFWGLLPLLYPPIGLSREAASRPLRAATAAALRQIPISTGDTA